MGRVTRTPRQILETLIARVPTSNKLGGTDYSVLQTRLDILIRQTGLAPTPEIKRAVKGHWRVVIAEANKVLGPSYFEGLNLTESERAAFKRFINA